MNGTATAAADGGAESLVRQLLPLAVASLLAFGPQGNISAVDRTLRVLAGQRIRDLAAYRTVLAERGEIKRLGLLFTHGEAPQPPIEDPRIAVAA